MDDLLVNLNRSDSPDVQRSRFYSNLLKTEWSALTKSEVFTIVLNSEPPLATDATDEELLHLAVGCLLTVVQHNFLGPVEKRSIEGPCKSSNNILTQLGYDGEELNVNVEKPECLLVCKKIFDHLILHGDGLSDPSMALCLRLWYQRYLLIHQRCLNNLAHNLYEKFNTNVSAIESALVNADGTVRTEHYLEILLGYVQFKRITKSEQWLNKVECASGVTPSLIGLMGTRTRFQQNPLPQLTVRLNGLENLALPAADSTHGNVELPSVLTLNDDVRLEKVKFVDDSENEDPQLPALVQNMVLGKLYHNYVSQPKEQLTLEKVQPYITLLAYQRHGPWATRVATLFLNASIEATHKRTVDRSLRQIEGLVQLLEAFSDGTEDSAVADRFSLAFSSWLIPSWQLKEKLADVMVTLGMVKGALDIYQQVQSWENVIDCYTRLEMRHLAANVISELMEQNGPSVQLHCMLGDATDNVDCYRQAWELSGETSASAQRHWGNYFFVRKDYASAIEHLRRSIEINCLQEPTLLRLGYAALQLERWEEAAYAYRLYTSFESRSFEPWNNLAKAYIMLGEKTRAHKVLQEALKCNYGNWQVWENFLLVSVDTRNIEDALNAYERLLELKERYHDRQVLDIVIRTIVLDEQDADGHACARLKKKAIKLLGHACAQQPNNGYLYALAAELEDANSLKRCQKLYNAYRGYTQTNSKWEKTPDTCLMVVNLSVDLCESSLKMFENGKASLGDKDRDQFFTLRSHLSSARIASQACLRCAGKEEWPECVEPLRTLEELVGKMTTEVSEAMKIQ